ncbi:MAG TPA: phosphatase PAP2 family protein [Pseudobdellovibrionaceae bacterium]|nr:phosphatase PAP2 family protein [Pseudobdellovibrionaceae bacterium]
MSSLLHNGFDLWLFQALNSDFHSELLDAIAPVLTDLHQQTWFPAAILIIAASFLATKRQRLKQREFWRNLALQIAFVGVSAGLADAVAYRGIKIWVKRDRPEAYQREVDPMYPVQLRTHSHSGYSFPSNHAANTFALARSTQILTQIASATGRTHPAAWAIYALATSVGLSRVYVGVHWPSDVLIGGLIGWLVASGLGWLLRRRLRSAGYSSHERKTDPSS